MALINWSPLFDSGDPTIDEQHRSLVTTINRLDSAHSWGTGRHAMTFVLDELDNYTRVHFGTEERFFAEVGYPEAEAHKALHRYFAERVVELRQGFEAGDREAVAKLLGVLGDWFVRHVADEDLKYRPWLGKRK
jgi:hemerythrin-like metal-binding protein